MTPQDQGAGTDPVREAIGQFLNEFAIAAQGEDYAEWNGIGPMGQEAWMLDADRILAVIAKVKGIDPTQGKARKADIDPLQLLIALYRLNCEGVWTLPDEHYRLITQMAELLYDVSDPAKDEAQGKESDGPEASPLQYRNLVPGEIIQEGDEFSTHPSYKWQKVDDSIGHKYGQHFFPMRRPIPALNAERSDAPSPNPPPNPLETAKDVLTEVLAYMSEPRTSWENAEYIIKALQSHGYEITRTGGKA